jgi:ankyrin repeat protein
MRKEMSDFIKGLSGFPSFDWTGEITVSTRSREGDWPIHYAAIQNEGLVIEQMLESGVEVNVRGEDDFTPLDYALLHGHLALADYLRSKGGEANRI